MWFGEAFLKGAKPRTVKALERAISQAFGMVRPSDLRVVLTLWLRLYQT